VAALPHLQIKAAQLTGQHQVPPHQMQAPIQVVVVVAVAAPPDNHQATDQQAAPVS
jgi:hypothetical protein